MKNNCPHRKPAHRGFSLFQVLGAGLFLCCAPSCAGGAEKKNIQFNRDIRAILSDNCYSCHGPDKDKRKAMVKVFDEHETQTHEPCGYEQELVQERPPTSQEFLLWCCVYAR